MATRSNLAVVAPSTKGREEGFSAKKAIQASLTSEIVIALCGPLGTPLHEVATTFQKLLKTTDYAYDKVEIIRLSELIKENTPANNFSEFPSINELIDAGNKLRESHGNDVLARLAIKKITLAREILKSKLEKKQDDLFLEPNESVDGAGGVVPTFSEKNCHIIDSIKHIDELRLLKSIYGDMLHVIGVYSPIEKRIEKLERKKGKKDDIHTLIDRDSGEEVQHGQRVETTFPHADFFLRVDSETDSERKGRVKRFLDLMLGTAIMTPTPHERAMYAAYSAARNSACLSRQVGAAIIAADGEMISTGWNDVPRPFGGLYETGDKKSNNDADHRCWNLNDGGCFNDDEKNKIASTMVDLLLSNGIVAIENKEKVYRTIRDDSQLKSLIEFSRAVHAEMHALINAGSNDGSKIKGGKLFVTTYPCHSCARHIVAAGISEVYFLEPYRKSLATKLHADAITEREDAVDKVRLMPFDGVAPSRFLKFFSMREGGRKDKSGKMIPLVPHPVTSITMEAITTLESFAVRELQSTGLAAAAPHA
ncbi:MAG: anti-phage dCTP deaminase [Comamonas sp.]